MESSYVSSNLLPSLNISPAGKHVLTDFYGKITAGKNQMDNEQLKEGLYPYIKMGISDPQDPEKVWVGMQIIASNAKNWQTVNNKLGGLYNSFYRVTSMTSITSYYNPQVTNIDFTTKALESARKAIQGDITPQLNSWKIKLHNKQDTENLIVELTALQNLILTVIEVVECVRKTYEEYQENAGSILDENLKLKNFTKSLSAEIQNLEIDLLNQLEDNLKSGIELTSLAEAKSTTQNENSLPKIRRPLPVIPSPLNVEKKSEEKTLIKPEKTLDVKVEEKLILKPTEKKRSIKPRRFAQKITN